MGNRVSEQAEYSGTVASFTGTVDSSITNLTANIDPTQDLHGYAKPWPAGGGKNKINLYDIASLGKNVTETENGYSFTVTSAQYSTGISFTPLTGIYTLSCKAKNETANNFRIRIHYSDGTTKESNGTGTQTEFVELSVTSDGSKSVDGVRFNWAAAGSVEVVELQLEQGTSKTAYAPYSNICPISGRTGLSVYVSPTQNQQDATTYAVNWTSQAGTVYGGTVDVVTGLLTVSRANIPSYNGETINEPWLSSMDAYAAGTTPTIGAQVVYTLSTPLTYQLTPKQVATLVGQNNVWSSTGGTVNVTVYSELTGFHGWLIKVKQGNNLVEIPLTLIRAETYRSTPDQRMEWSAERDITGVLHRETVLNTPPKIEFNTPLLTNKEINALNTIIRNGFTNALSRDVTIQFYDNEKDEYWQWDCYMPDVEYTIRNVDIANNVINYEELRYAFIGY